MCISMSVLNVCKKSPIEYRIRKISKSTSTTIDRVNTSAAVDPTKKEWYIHLQLSPFSWSSCTNFISFFNTDSSWNSLLTKISHCPLVLLFFGVAFVLFECDFLLLDMIYRSTRVFVYHILSLSVLSEQFVLKYFE